MLFDESVPISPAQSRTTLVSLIGLIEQQAHPAAAGEETQRQTWRRLEPPD